MSCIFINYGFYSPQTVEESLYNTLEGQSNANCVRFLKRQKQSFIVFFTQDCFYTTISRDRRIPKSTHLSG